jgi:hypothetical protein
MKADWWSFRKSLISFYDSQNGPILDDSNATIFILHPVFFYHQIVWIWLFKDMAIITAIKMTYATGKFAILLLQFLCINSMNSQKYVDNSFVFGATSGSKPGELKKESQKFIS